MYIDHFRLKQLPFSIAPDPRYLFMSERHREALAHLLYGVDSGGGLVLLTGEIGTGKTTLCRCLLEQVPSHCDIAYVFNPKLTVPELLESICAEFHIAPPDGERRGGTRGWIDALNRFLLAQHAAGRNNVLVIDEAQNLAPEVLEQLRLLTNLETNERKLLQIILIGQPELRAMLAQPELEQLAQRVIAHYHLSALDEQETASYVQHRLATAGLSGPSPFQPGAVRSIHRLSDGVPRRINLLCDRAMLGAYAQGMRTVDRRIVEHAASELFINQRNVHATPHSKHWRPLALGTAAGILVAAGAALLVSGQLREQGWSGIHLQQVLPAIAAANAGPTSDATGKAGDTRLEQEAVTQAEREAEGETDSTTPPMQPIVPEHHNGAFSGIAEERQALRELAVLWGWSEADGEPCDTRRQQSLRCFRSGGGLSELRRLDRPALLKLHDANGKLYFALLTALTETGVRLQAGAAHQDVSLAQLTRHFRGEFATLWRAPPGSGDTIVLGQMGAAVDWVGTQLARVHNTDLPAERQPYNLGLHRQVRLFQQAHGLSVDGVVGPLTFMHLNRVAGVAEPRLLAGAGGK